MAEDSYLARGVMPIGTESSVLVSSSKYLNNPRLRDWLTMIMLRKNGPDMPPPAEMYALLPILEELRDHARIEEMFAAERKVNPLLDDWFTEGFISTYQIEDFKDYAPGTLGGMVIPNVARIQPARLVRGLAQAVERRGVRIAEGTAVLGIAPGRVETDRGTVSAAIILRATEGFTAGLPGHRRDWLPLNSAQIVTAPLPPETWASIGWDGYEIFEDFAHAYSYCQRTDDGRITVGARGVPYRYGSATDRDGAPDPATIDRLTAILQRLFPAAAEAPIDHAWCGVLGVPRDWCATVGFDPSTGIGWAGGYVGVGVSTSNLAGQTLADLATGADTALVRLPWVNRRVRRWEPEPLRWLGVHGMYALLAAADRAEARGGGPSRLAAIGNWLTGS